VFEQGAEAFGFVIVAAIAVALIWLPLSWRSTVRLQRRFAIKADIDTVWQAINMSPGKVLWHPNLTEITSVNEADGIVRLCHAMTSPDGRSPTWTFDMQVTTEELGHEPGQEQGKSFIARRIDLDDIPTTDDRLLEISASVTERAGTTTLDWHESWGKRSLAGRFMAYSDADRALSQLKSFCEDGKVSVRQARSAGSALSLFSAFVTVATFALLIGWEMAILLASILVIHEFGHLRSFRMVGQPWGRVMFVPFVGGVAVSRMGHTKLADDVFCALMGAGLSVILIAPAYYLYFFADVGAANAGYYQTLALTCAALAGAINLLNLLPIFPLDGGRVMRAAFQSFAPDHVRHWMFAIAGLIGGAALMLQNSILAALAVIAFFQTARLGPPKGDMKTMTPMSILVLGTFYAGLMAAHGAAFWLFRDTLMG
jgi:Zn-dependent protease